MIIDKLLLSRVCVLEKFGIVWQGLRFLGQYNVFTCQIIKGKGEFQWIEMKNI